MQCVWRNLSWNMIPMYPNSPIHLFFLTSFRKPLCLSTKSNACEIGKVGNQESFFSSDFILNFQKNLLPLYIVDLITHKILMMNWMWCYFWGMDAHCECTKIQCRWISLNVEHASEKECGCVIFMVCVMSECMHVCMCLKTYCDGNISGEL